MGPPILHILAKLVFRFSTPKNFCVAFSGLSRNALLGKSHKSYQLFLLTHCNLITFPKDNLNVSVKWNDDFVNIYDISVGKNNIHTTHFTVVIFHMNFFFNTRCGDEIKYANFTTCIENTLLQLTTNQ